MIDHLDGLPPFIHVGPFDLKVIRKDKLDEDDSWGIYTPGISIELRNGQPTAAFAVDTVIHDIDHAIDRTYGISGREENVVLGMSAGIVTVLKDNPGLLKWIVKSLK